MYRSALSATEDKDVAVEEGSGLQSGSLSIIAQSGKVLADTCDRTPRISGHHDDKHVVEVMNFCATLKVFL